MKLLLKLLAAMAAAAAFGLATSYFEVPPIVVLWIAVLAIYAVHESRLEDLAGEVELLQRDIEELQDRNDRLIAVLGDPADEPRDSWDSYPE